MPTLARPPLARLTARVTLITTIGAASCVPLQDLDEYRQPNTGTPAVPPAGPAEDPGGEEAVGSDPPNNAGSAGASAGEGTPVPSGPLSGTAGASGNGQLGGNPSTPDPEALERIDAGVGAADAAPLGPCLTDERLGPNGNCYFVQATPATWATARQACLAHAQGWDLASVRSAADAAFLGQLLTIEAWIGASDAENEGTWLWINDGAPFWIGGADGVPADDAYTNWNATEPNGATTTNCARALPPAGPGASNGDAPWADLDCEQQRGAVCEGPR